MKAKALSSATIFLCSSSSSRCLFFSRKSLDVESLLRISHFSTSSLGSSSSSSSSSRRHSDESRNVRVSVWWDFENCSIPCNANVYKVTRSITVAVRENGIKGPIQITAFGDVLQLSRPNQEALSSTGVTLTHIPHGGKNSADRSLLVDLMYWVSQNPPPAHLFLISGDRDFAGILHRLRMNNYNILLASSDNAPAVLCSAASIMWQWSALAKGENLSGKHFNQPPDGPFASWYGHYRVPLEDPYAVYNQTLPLQSEKLSDSFSDAKFRPVPKAVMDVIGNILHSYPKGISITELRSELAKSNVNVDKDFYGYKKFSRFLLSMPHLVKLQFGREGQFSVYGVGAKGCETCVPTPYVSTGPNMSTTDSVSVFSGIDPESCEITVPTPVLATGPDTSTKDSVSVFSGIGPERPETYVASGDMATGPNASANDSVSKMSLKENGSHSSTIGSIEEKLSSPSRVTQGKQEGPQRVEEPPLLVEKSRNGEVSVCQSPQVEGRRPTHGVGVFKKTWRKWFSGNYGSHEELCDTVHKSSAFDDSTKPVKADMKCVQSTSQSADLVRLPKSSLPPSDIIPDAEIAKDSAADVAKSSKVRGGIFNQIARWFKFWRNDDNSDNLKEESSKSNKDVSSPLEMQEKYPESFWNEMSAFLETPKGLETILQSKTRQEIVQNLQQHGPSTLQSLSERQILHLVDLLVSEKKWVEECPSQTSPFRLNIGPVGFCLDSKLVNSNEEKRGIKESDSISQGRAHHGEDRCQNHTHVGGSMSSMNKKFSPKVRSQILRDCQKLVKEVMNQYPEGFNIGSFKKLFLNRYGYRLEVQQLGYQKLATLLQIMPGLKLESNYIIPSGNISNGSKSKNAAPKIKECTRSDVSRKEDGRDSLWDELGPVTQMNPKKDDMKPSTNATEDTRGQIHHDFETLSDDDLSDSEGEILQKGFGNQAKHGTEEDSSLLRILDSWYSHKDDTNRRVASDCSDTKIDYSNHGFNQSLSGEALKNNTTLANYERKQRPSKSYSFVAEKPCDEKEKVIDGIMGNLKKSSDGLPISKVEV